MITLFRKVVLSPLLEGRSAHISAQDLFLAQHSGIIPDGPHSRQTPTPYSISLVSDLSFTDNRSRPILYVLKFTPPEWPSLTALTYLVCSKYFNKCLSDSKTKLETKCGIISACCKFLFFHNGISLLLKSVAMLFTLGVLRCFLLFID